MKRKTISIIALALSVLISAFCLAGCGGSKSDDSKSALIGTWEATDEGAEGCAYVFSEDGKGKWNTPDFPMNFNYVDNGKEVKITYEGSSDGMTWEYTIKDNNLTMKEKDTGTVLNYKKK